MIGDHARKFRQVHPVQKYHRRRQLSQPFDRRLVPRHRQYAVDKLVAQAIDVVLGIHFDRHIELRQLIDDERDQAGQIPPINHVAHPVGHDGHRHRLG